MRRFCLLALLTLLSSSAHAGSFSFSVSGRRIHIESSRYCRSSSCTSISISEILQSRRTRADGEPVKPAAAPAAVPTSAVIQPVITPGVAPAPPPPAVFKPAAVVTQTVSAPVQPSNVAPPAPPAMRPAISAPPAPPPPPVERPIEAMRPAPPAPPARVSQQAADEFADTPLGDWQTEGKGGVRITRCGRALCGYVINASNDRGEAVLVNMKPKSDTQWTGNVYSRDSGDTYYGTMEMKGSNTLRVEACALGRFYCSGNNWSRIIGHTEHLISSRQGSTEPRS